MNRIEKALQLRTNWSYNCAQAVFISYSDLFDVPEAMAKQISAGFGAGVGRSENICGAISGAIMILGLKNYHKFGDPDEKEKIYEISRNFVEKFKEIHGSDNCEPLLDLKEKGGFDCARYIQSACELLEEELQIEN